ncbi:uncharacterized protein ACLA_050600 [Aspergillus clavatus NRRL 1]|uniref:Nucleic acid-binding protein n=1 Tax=Aspergillus clavatus (strain ATCC 1007 / CBS 513.65 / DSM 816 / NCTC 3887 / NRRL 1 / QM 1276 / 107) TaxID=344612 RepID=A1CI83_ASPCL|nr:uncharacterized protein ACLA_050600 [Aspergillus clavatus NRRL 1]EAW10588.1 conserved hypothetical protein [Aspergillus clavatus NRRL 1]
MSRKFIFLVGAPTSHSLRWDEDELLDRPIYPFSDPTTPEQGTRAVSNGEAVKWMLLQDVTAPARNHHQFSLGSNGDALFFTTQDLTLADAALNVASEKSAISRFYDHSFAVYETSEISTTGLHATMSVLESGSWADSTGTSSATPSDRGTPALGSVSIAGGISDLGDIPSATYLQSIIPQTMTMNLVVGIIVVHPPRRIVTRQWKRELDLVEVVVGDETKTGFGVTFWLNPADEAPANHQYDSDAQELRKTLSSLRPRDIVLLRTVGLSSFRERVYGQSLRRGVTTVELLHRQRVDATDAGGFYSARRLHHLAGDEAQSEDPLLLKVRKVREWIRRFVDTAPDRVGGEHDSFEKRGQPALLLLPPDTQE